MKETPGLEGKEATRIINILSNKHHKRKNRYQKKVDKIVNLLPDKLKL